MPPPPLKETPPGKGCEKKVMDPAAARRSNDINQVCRTGTKGVRCAPYPFINPLSNRVERQETWQRERERGSGKPRLFNQIMIRDAQTQDVFFVGITLNTSIYIFVRTIVYA